MSTTSLVSIQPLCVAVAKQTASLVILLVATLAGTGAGAQCGTQWLPATGYNGTDDTVAASTTWDPDGAGPATPRLVLAGRFTVAGTVFGSVATWDPASGAWSALPGLGSIRCLTTLANGDLVAGGSEVRRWNGTSWTNLGLNGVVNALLALPNGDLVAAGSLSAPGTTAVIPVARWNGSSWLALGSGMSGGSVNALAALANGDIIAGGAYSFAGGVAASNIARWNGSNWAPMGAGTNGAVWALKTLPNGDLLAGGSFSTADGIAASRIARWDGTSWNPLGSGVAGVVTALAELPNGDVVAGGGISSAGGVAANAIARWNGASWSALGSGMTGGFATGVATLTTLQNGDLFAGGDFSAAGGIPANYTALWSGSSWSALAAGTNGDVSALATLPNGDVIAGGPFTTLGGVSANHLARWNGASWSALGSGTNGSVYALMAMPPSGDVIAAGTFTLAGGVAANNIARWNGSSWSALGSGLNGSVGCLLRLPNGDLIAGGSFTTAGGVAADNIARWNGASWSALGSGRSGAVAALATLPNGNLVAASYSLTIPSMDVGSWDGTSWAAMGSGMNEYVQALTTLPNGDVLAGGRFTNAGGAAVNRIARWNGTAWLPFGPTTWQAGMINSGDVNALATLPNGDLVIGGNFSTAGFNSARGIARGDGASWSSVGNILGGLGVFDLTTQPDGQIVAGGRFTTAGGLVSVNFARVATTCPATVIPAGAGCSGSGGLNLLTAASRPWIGATFTSTATGMPPMGLALTVLGLTPAGIPLANILPQGGAGCSLLVSPDLLDLQLPSAGSLTASLAIPNTIALATQVLRQQIVPVELDAAGNIIALTSTNALTLTIGAF